MSIYMGISGKQYALAGQVLASGGEGSVFAIQSEPGRVAKIYHSATGALEKKITLMVRRPPPSHIMQQLAWPLDVLRDSAGQFKGFVMRKLDATDELLKLYKYPPMEFESITLRHRLIIAQNICSVISGVHQAGYVFGDFNSMNIGVNLKTGSVAFFDTDSYHIRDPYSNEVYRCGVCLPGYVAPELITACKRYKVSHPSEKEVYAHMPLPTFTEQTDNFALAIHIFKLLMNGFSPFNGVDAKATVSQASPGLGDVAVERDNYCFKPGFKPQAEATPPLDSLPKEVQNLFHRAFIQGRSNPMQRPSASEWRVALEQYENSLIICQHNPNHLYFRQNAICPWCEAKRRFQARLNPSTMQLKTNLTPYTPTKVPYTPRRTATAQQSTPLRQGTGWQSQWVFWSVTMIASALLAGMILWLFREKLGNIGGDFLWDIIGAVAPYGMFIGALVGTGAYNIWFTKHSASSYALTNYLWSIVMGPAGMLASLLAIIVIAYVIYVVVGILIVGAILAALFGMLSGG